MVDKDSFQKLLKTVKKLRSPDGGCPWDREQTTQSLRPFLVEETYETIEVMDQIKDPSDFKKPNLKKAFIEEWGDVLLQVLLNAEVASETESDINIDTIINTLNEKLIRRHPHVFGTTNAKTSDEALQNWNEIKKQEKGSTEKIELTLHNLGTGLPPIPRTLKIIQKVSKVGFQWPDLKGPISKLQEEVDELKHELTLPKEKQNLQKIEDELGDVLFSVCNIGYFTKVDPESALRSTLRKFEKRFNYVETKLIEKNIMPGESNLEEMDRLWSEAKKLN